MTTICGHCLRPLRFDPSRGWIHATGGLYLMFCSACGHSSAEHPSPVACPNCGRSDDWRDDHCATPVETGSAAEAR